MKMVKNLLILIKFFFYYLNLIHFEVLELFVSFYNFYFLNFHFLFLNFLNQNHLFLLMDLFYFFLLLHPFFLFLILIQLIFFLILCFHLLIENINLLLQDHFFLHKLIFFDLKDFYFLKIY